MVSRTVYCWADSAAAESIVRDQRFAERNSAPAIRVWGDVIIELIAQKLGLEPTPPVGIRQDAAFAWVTRTPLPLALADSTRVQLELEVDTSACAIARADCVDPLFSPPEWRALSLWLQERGHLADLIGEEIMTIEAPVWPMTVSAGYETVTSTRADLLEDVLCYFEPDVRRYLESWQQLSLWVEDPNGAWEVVVPNGAIVRVAREC